MKLADQSASSASLDSSTDHVEFTLNDGQVARFEERHGEGPINSRDYQGCRFIRAPAVPDELEELLPYTLADLEVRM